MLVLDSHILSFGCLHFVVLFTGELPLFLLTSEFLETSKKVIQLHCSGGGCLYARTQISVQIQLKTEGIK